MRQSQNRENSRISISIKEVLLWLLLVLLTLPHTNPGYLNQIPSWDFIINVGRMASFIITLFLVVIVKRKVSMIVVLMVIQQMFLLCTTMFHKGDLYTCITSAFSVISVVLLYDFVQEKGKIFLSSQLFCFEVVIYINFITECLYPEGMYISTSSAFVDNRNWFLGYYNNHSKYYIPALMFAWLYYEYTKKRKRTILLTTIIFLSAVLVWSGGVIMSLLIIALVFIFFKKKTWIFNYYTYWLIHVLFFIFIIKLKWQNMFRWLIDGYIGKWNSLMARMLVWDRTQALISNSFISGYGIRSSFYRATELGVGWASTHSHNMLLELLYQGGLVNLAMYIIIILVSGKSIYQFKSTRESMIIALAFLGWCVATLVEPFTSSFLMGMFVIAYNYNADVEEERQHEK